MVLRCLLEVEVDKLYFPPDSRVSDHKVGSDNYADRLHVHKAIKKNISKEMRYSYYMITGI